MDDWDPNAERLHGLSVEQLRREGSTPKDVCKRMNDALAGIAIYSDAPDWDGFWLYRLFAAAGVKTKLKLLDYADLVRPLAIGREEQLFAKAQAISPRTHRAKDDATHLLALYKLACNDR